MKKCVYTLSFALRDRMVRTLLSDEVWNKVHVILPGKEGDRGRTASNNRWFLDAVLWIARTGSPWRDLPAEFGRWHTVYIRCSRWRSKGVRARVANALAGETEIAHILIDSTIVRAHQHSAGALKKRAASARTFSRRTEHQTASGGGFERSPVATDRR